MTDDSKGGRIAIKFGAPSSSSSHSSKLKPKPTPASSLGKRPRTHAFGGGGGDSDSDGDDNKRGQHEAITGFGVDGAETERARSNEEVQKKEYVIARQPNRDWRDEIREQRGARRSKNLLPAEARAAAAAAAQNGGGGSSSTADTAPADQDSGIQWGLTVKEKKPANAETPSAATADDNHDKDTRKQAEPAPPPPPPQSADDEAMDALLGKRPAKDTPKVITTEDDAYARDVSAAGAASTLADYDAMPVEEFGAALLRGMGWNGEPSSSSKNPSKARMPQRRQNRLGLGAKALNEAEDLGGWNQKGRPGAAAGKKRPPKLADYRREEERKREGRDGGGREESYKREREREREEWRRGDGERRRGDGERERGGHRYGDRDRERERERHRGYDRDRRR